MARHALSRPSFAAERTRSCPAQRLAAALEVHQDLRLTRLACGKLERALPARLRENEWGVAREAGQLSSRPFGGSATGRTRWPLI